MYSIAVISRILALLVWAVQMNKANEECVNQFFILGNNNSDALSPRSSESLSHPDHNSNSIANITPKLICFYLFTNNFNPSIMVDLCTHINVGFFTINEKTYGIDNSTEKLKALEQILLLKRKRKELKILISIGGADFNGFSSMIKNHSTRKMFIKSAIHLLKKFKINGIDLDWEWPVLSGNAKEKIKFIQLLYEMREEFNRHKNKYILSIDVAALKSIIDAAYNVQYIADYVDFVNIMCYDYHFYTKLLPITEHNAPLYSSAHDWLFSTYNVNYSVHYWTSNSMPKEKIVLGIPTYGHSYWLSSSEKVGLNAPATDYGLIGQSGFATYPQICLFIQEQNATVVFDNQSKVPYTYKFPNWISYDNEFSLTFKVNFVKEQKLSGVMVYSVNADDFSGICNENGTPLPLIRKIKSILLQEN